MSLILVAVGLLASARVAHAQAAAAAEAEFDRGRQLMSAGKVDDACAAFERSQKLDPQIGTRYNLGVCYEKLGKLASSWSAFREVAQRDTNESRRQDAGQRAAELAPRLTKLLLSSEVSPPGFAVTLNGADATNLLGVESPVDPGSYTIVATAPGFKAWTETVDATREATTVQVKIAALTPGDAAPDAIHSAALNVRPAKDPERYRWYVGVNGGFEEMAAADDADQFAGIEGGLQLPVARHVFVRLAGAVKYQGMNVGPKNAVGFQVSPSIGYLIASRFVIAWRPTFGFSTAGDQQASGMTTDNRFAPYGSLTTLDLAYLHAGVYEVGATVNFDVAIGHHDTWQASLAFRYHL